jgi:hypothetical protein
MLVVPIEAPVPTNSGGRVDVARRLGALRDAGHDTAVLTWHNVARDGAWTAALQAQLGSLCSTQHVSLIRRSALESLRRLAHLWHLPSHAASRWVTLDKPAALAWARRFAPDVVMLDGLYGVAVVRWLARQLGVPWVYRSHNIEHLYMRYQRRAAAGAGARLRLSANLLGLQRVEERLVRDAACVYDISVADAAFWRERCGRQVHWLPTIVDAGFEAAMLAAAAQPAVWDVVYFGNLNTPNNVEAVRWLITQIVPKLPGPQLRVALAGSRPSDEVRRLAATDPRVTLLADLPSIPSIAGAARVLVNPVQGGSGVNLKSVEMLFSAAHLVSTPAGVQGLPAEAVACFAVHAEATAFAQAVARALEGKAPIDVTVRARARAPFTPAGSVGVLADTLQPVLVRSV